MAMLLPLPLKVVHLQRIARRHNLAASLGPLVDGPVLSGFWVVFLLAHNFIDKHLLQLRSRGPEAVLLIAGKSGQSVSRLVRRRVLDRSRTLFATLRIVGKPELLTNLVAFLLFKC